MTILKEELKKVKDCLYCKKLIYFNEKYVLIGTYEGYKTYDEQFMHWDCFNLWYNEKVRQKAENIVKSMQQKAIQSVGSILSKTPFSNIINKKTSFIISNNGTEKTRRKTRRTKKIQ